MLTEASKKSSFMGYFVVEYLAIVEEYYSSSHDLIEH